MEISYVRQMNGFMARMQADHLSGNAVKLYLCLFDAFNKGYWKKDWLRLTTGQLKLLLGTSSTSLIYSNRKCLEDLGYIQVRRGYVANRPYTEFRLIPLGGKSSPQEAARIPAKRISDGISHGISNAPQPLSHKAPPLPKTEDYKDKYTTPHKSIPGRESININTNTSPAAPQPQEMPSVTQADFEEIYQVFEVCFGREASTQEKISLVRCLQDKGREPVETALIAMGEAQEAYSPELCQRHIQHQLYASKEPAPRRQEPVAGWPRFRLA